MQTQSLPVLFATFGLSYGKNNTACIFLLLTHDRTVIHNLILLDNSATKHFHFFAKNKFFHTTMIVLSSLPDNVTKL